MKRPKQRTAEPKFKGEMRGQHSKRNAMDGMEKGRKRWKKVLQGFRIQRAIFCHSDTHNRKGELQGFRTAREKVLNGLSNVRGQTG